MSSTVYTEQIVKPLHIKLLFNTHAGLKIQAFKLGLTMQTIMDEMAGLVAEEDPYVISHLKEVARQKREKKMAHLRATDSDTILDAIEEDAKRRDK